MKFILISPKNRTVYNFRGDLIREIIRQGYEVVVTGPDSVDADKICALGARLSVIPMNKTGTNIIKDLRYCNALKTFLKKEKPDVVLAYTVKPVIYGAIAAKKAGIKNMNCMITGAGYTFTAKSFKAKVMGMLVRILYRYAFRKARTVIFQNPDDLKEFCERKLVNREKAYCVNGSGVNIDRFSAVSLPDQPRFLMVSRLLKSKGVKEYLEAAEEVKLRYPQAEFYLLGKYEPEMQDGINKEFVERFIKDGIVCRFEETSDVRPYYEKCSVYVLPSYREGTPRTVLEAMAMGRPIITTDAQGCRETVVDNRNGFLIPVRDVCSLVKKMEYFIENPNEIQRMGMESRKYVIEKFDVRKVNDKMLNIMQISNHSQAR